MFSVNSKIQQADAERETEYSLMLDVMRKLVQALEDKTSHDLFSKHYGEETYDNRENSMLESYSLPKTDNNRRMGLARKQSQQMPSGTGQPNQSSITIKDTLLLNLSLLPAISATP